MVSAMTHDKTLMENSTYRTGLENLYRIEGKRQPSIIDGLSGISPDLATLAISFVYGQIYSRPSLTLKERQLVSVAVLAALGNARPQLKFHIAGALKVGCSTTEIVELMLHLVIYAGFPVGLNGVFAAREVFQEQGIPHHPARSSAGNGEDAERTRYQTGWDALLHIDGHAGEKIIDSLANLAPDLGRFIVEFAFGDIYPRAGLGLLQRELATVAALAALGTATAQIRVHMHGLLNVGGTSEQLVEILIDVAPYAGFPAAINAMLIAGEVLAEREKSKSGT